MASRCRFRKLRPRSLVAGSEPPAPWLAQPAGEVLNVSDERAL